MLKLFYLTVFSFLVLIFICCGCEGNTNQAKENELKFTPNINRTKCPGQTICNEVANYPTEYIEELLKQNNITRKYHLFGSDTRVAIVSRFNIMSDGNSLCRSKKQLVKPQAGLNEVGNEWFFLINHGPYEQGIEVDICEDEFKPCYMNNLLPLRTECRQKYIYRKMLAIGGSGKMDVKTVKLPACCSCHYFKK